MPPTKNHFPTALPKLKVLEPPLTGELRHRDRTSPWGNYEERKDSTVLNDEKRSCKPDSELKLELCTVTEITLILTRPRIFYYRPFLSSSSFSSFSAHPQNFHCVAIHFRNICFHIYSNPYCSQLIDMNETVTKSI